MGKALLFCRGISTKNLARILLSVTLVQKIAPVAPF